MGTTGITASQPGKTGPGPSNNISSTTFPHWKEAVGAARAGSRSAKLLFVGASICQGFGSAPDGFGIPGFVASVLNSMGTKAQRGLAVASFPGTGHTADPRIVYGSGWGLAQVAGGWWGGNGYYHQGVVGAAGNLVFTPDSSVVCDHFDIYYWQTAGLGTVNAQGTGGAITPLVTAGVDGIGKATVACAANNNTNTLTFSSVTVGPVVIIGIEPWSVATPGVLVGNTGQGTTSAVSWANTAGGNHDSLACIQKYAPDLTAIELGINDAVANATPTAVMTALTAIAAAAAISGDVVYLTETPTATVSAITAQYNAVMQAAGLPIIDNFTRWGGLNGYTTLNPLGYYFDTFHPSQPGYADLGQSFAAAMTDL